MYNINKKNIQNNDLASWIRLARSHNIGTKTMMKFIDLYGNCDKAIDEISSIARQNKSRIKITPVKLVEDEIKSTRKFGAEFLIPTAKNYPKALLQIHDFPLVLCVKGNLELLDKQNLAVVGSRNCSLAGKKFSYIIGQELSKAGIAVVSGLASGIDTAAHTGALEEAAKGGSTVAVIAGGIDNIYPKDNAKLYEEVATKGLLMTESAIGSKPTANHFPRRNRIIAGLSRGVVVVEANKNSGSLITSRLALEYGREVFAVPGHPLEARSEGANSLIKQGATLIESAADIIDNLRFADMHVEINDNKAEFKPQAYSVYQLQSLRERILSLLSATPVAIDDLHADLGCSASIFQQAMVELELAGLLSRDTCNQYVSKVF